MRQDTAIRDLRERVEALETQLIEARYAARPPWVRAAACDRFVYAAAAALDLTPRELRSSNRRRDAIRARRVVMLLMDAAGHPSVEIGRALHRSHSTVLYHLELLNDPARRHDDPALLDALHRVRQALAQPAARPAETEPRTSVRGHRRHNHEAAAS